MKISTSYSSNKKNSLSFSLSLKKDKHVIQQHVLYYGLLRNSRAKKEKKKHQFFSPTTRRRIQRTRGRERFHAPLSTRPAQHLVRAPPVIPTERGSRPESARQPSQPGRQEKKRKRKKKGKLRARGPQPTPGSPCPHGGGIGTRGGPHMAARVQ